MPALSPGGALALRDATPSDRPFLLALYASTRADEFAGLDWPPDMARAFMQLQFEAQRGDYERRHADARCRIVEWRACPVGRLWIAREAANLRVLDISLVAQMRRQGIGTECLRRVQRQAAAAGLGVALQVVLGSPAQRLYERLGFHAVGEPGVHQAMAWHSGLARAALIEEIQHEQA